MTDGWHHSTFLLLLAPPAPAVDPGAAWFPPAPAYGEEACFVPPLVLLAEDAVLLAGVPAAAPFGCFRSLPVGESEQKLNRNSYKDS